MEDLECFLVEEGPDIWPGCPELENSFSSSLDAWWNGHMSDLDGNDLNLSSLLEEGDSAHTSIPRLSVLHTKMKNNNNNNNNENKKQNNNSNNNNKNKKQNNNKKLMGSLNQMDLIRNSSLLDEDESTLQPSSSIGSINQIEQLQQQSNDDEEAEEEESDSDDKKANAPNSKNLVSERNRRKRLNQQLFSLRSLIPNITKMDKRSILVDALAYLQSILQQIEREKENTNITEDSSCDDDSLDVQEEIPPMQPQELIPCDSLAISQDMYVGATGTTAAALEWAMTELIKSPNAMVKAQAEIRSVIGRKMKVEEEDLLQMDYLKYIIKETLRLHPPGPLLIPHESTSSVMLQGYFIPPKTTVLINAFAIGRDATLWENANEFLPERFVNNPVDFKGNDFQFIPFGAGRRICPGISFVNHTMELALANLLYWFDWEFPGGENKDIDMSEAPGFSIHKKIPLHLIPTYHFS